MAGRTAAEAEVVRLREVARRLATAHASLTSEHRGVAAAAAERVRAVEDTNAVLRTRVRMLERDLGGAAGGVAQRRPSHGV